MHNATEKNCLPRGLLWRVGPLPRELGNFENRQLGVMLGICKNDARLGATTLPEKFNDDVLILLATQGKREPAANGGRPNVRAGSAFHQVALRHESV